MTQPDNLPLPGEFFPRIARPYRNDPKGKGSPGYNPDERKEAREARVMSAGQLHAMIAQLEQICRVVYPHEDNYNAFGHEIRNILILGCTEVETQWKRILKENGIKKKVHEHTRRLF
jgi:hypothetical protein